MIKIFATGNIGKDAELKEINEDFSVIEFSIASNKKVKGEDVTTWLNCKKFNSPKLTPYLIKGTKVALSGELEIREHEGKYYTSMIVYELEFMSKPQNTVQATTPTNEQPPDGNFPF